MASKKQLVLFALACGLFAALMIAGLAGNVVRGNYTAIPIICSALALAVFAVWFSIWFNRRRVQNMFRDPTPDRLIAHYHATVRRIPSADAAAAYLAALAAAVYGQFDRAREELGAVDWAKASPMYQGHRLHVLAAIALLEKQDKAAAMQLASEALALEAADPVGSTPILHGAILIAAGEGDAAAIDQAKRAAGRSAGVMPAVCSWALSLHFERCGQSGEAARYRDRALKAVPYFVGLSGS